jgi:hypothetical protein
VGSAVLYGSCVLLILGSTTGFLARSLPTAIGPRLAHNSEAWVLILGLSAWIQFVGPKLKDRRDEWPITALAAVAFFLGGIVMVYASIPVTVATLNEGMFGLALLVPYVQVRRPIPSAVPWLVAGLVTIVAIAFNGTGVVTDQAETIGFLVLIPIGLDAVDRGILDDVATTRRAVRFAWYSFLVAFPLLEAVVERHSPHGIAGHAFRYGVRMNESFIAALAISLYFAVALGRVGSQQEIVDARRRQVLVHN